MNKAVKEFTGITTLHVPVPPMLAEAIGYKGEARFVSFQWTPYGDEADYSDGWLSGTGNWQAFLAYIQHPVVSPFLQRYDFGSSENEASHALILDRDKSELMIAPVKEARVFLESQWGTQQTIPLSKEEYLDMLSKALRGIKRTDDIDVEEIQRRIEEQYTMIEDMQRWLDRFLKN
jgi:hypothetical protein